VKNGSAQDDPNGRRDAQAMFQGGTGPKCVVNETISSAMMNQIFMQADLSAQA
jgi:hypothetical protein